MNILNKTFFLLVTALLSLFFNACSDTDVEISSTAYPVTHIGPTYGTIHATVSASGASIVDAGIVYSTSVTYPKITTCKYVQANQDSLTDFYITLKGLSTDSVYRFRSYARTSDSIYYGTVNTFRPMGISLSTVDVSGGTFTMGGTDVSALSNEIPTHSVKLSDFKIGKYEVTNAEFLKFLRSRCVLNSGYSMTSYGTSKMVISTDYKKALYYDTDSLEWMLHEGYENLPVVHVTWYGAKEFCLWAGGRLPTEAEWEYAARGGVNASSTIYSGSNTPEDVAWCVKNIDRLNYNVRPVGTKNANALQIYDMSGNAWEWVADWYDNYFSKAQTNPTGLTDDEASDIDITHKVRRGGGWADTDIKTLRVSSRGSNLPSTKSGSIGFRFAKDVN